MTVPRRARLLFASLWLLSAAAAAPAADPHYYECRATWPETALASMEAIARSDLRDGFAPFESETLRGGGPAQRVSVNVSGAREMYLFIAGVPDVKWAVADWADARLVRRDGTSAWISQSNRAEVLVGRCERDLTLKSGLYQKLRLNGQVFERGLNVQAPSIVRVPLNGEFERFEAWIGVDDWAGTNGTVRFSVVGPRSAARKQVFELVARDFEGGTLLDHLKLGTPRDQMNWEREDRIFEFDWAAGDWAALAKRYAAASHRVPPWQEQAEKLAAAVTNSFGLGDVRNEYLKTRLAAAALAGLRNFDFTALRQAIEDLNRTFPGQYPERFLGELDKLETRSRAVLSKFDARNVGACGRALELNFLLETLKREALLANPLLDFEQLLVIKRVPIGGARRTSWDGYGHGEFLGIPRQSSWNYGTMPNVDKYTNEIAVLSPVRPPLDVKYKGPSPYPPCWLQGTLTTLYYPPGTRLVNDLELNWDTDKLMFSMPDTNRNWQVCELQLDGVPAKPLSATSPAPRLTVKSFRQLTPSTHPDVHNYDGIYLPDGDIMFLSTAPLQGVPCNAGVIVGMMYKMGPNGERIRQLTFEQDHDYTPSVLNNGRVLYLRWDYTDTPHVWNRLLMSMNPDGTGQMEYYGANSYWPNAMFFARAIPNEETKIVTIVTGHHEGRVGELFILDPAKGRHETSGVVQRIPRKGPPVEARIEDKLTEHSWPKFLHPWPLSDKYFLVACKPDPDALWGIYLVDVFDNLTLVKEEEGFALLEPVPLTKRTRPPVLEDRVQEQSKDALVYLEDIYSGPGLRGVPRGTVKSLRLFTYHFGYQKLAGIDHRVGADGPWEAKRVLGTVPVEADGSALFRVPAKTPVSFQPLDAEGKAVALMRSWMTAMPGETASCVGCHDRQSGAAPGKVKVEALKRVPATIQPWRGPVHGFSFVRDVQPVLDKFCVGCHDGSTRSDGKTIPNLRRDQGGYVVYRGGELDGRLLRGVAKEDLLGKYGAVFEPSYVALRQYVRVGGLESDLHLLPPKEFHADTSELIQMLAKGHHNVKLDADAWDRLVTWIDLNAPCHGTWSETTKIPGNQCARRLELRKLYGGLVENCEEIPEAEEDYELPKPVMPAPIPEKMMEAPTVAGWPMSTEQARQLQAASGPVARTVDLGGGVRMELVRIPAGAFVMGDAAGAPDEFPPAVVRVEAPFWMGKCEVSNEQFGQFDAAHDSRFEHKSSWWFDEEYTGWKLNRPRQPVVRVSWQEATAFCRWLGAKLGEEVALPTEAQWEWACRAGTATPLSCGDLDTDFSKFANLGDASLRKLADEGWRPKSPDLVAKNSRFNDGALVTTEVGSYWPNAWGLHDLHGNAAEWTRSVYKPYPYRSEDPRDEANADTRRVVRGGSWRDRPKLSRSGYRWAYPAYQKVFNVGFRVVIEPSRKAVAATR